jgi:hypothetical protein
MALSGICVAQSHDEKVRRQVAAVSIDASWRLAFGRAFVCRNRQSWNSSLLFFVELAQFGIASNRAFSFCIRTRASLSKAVFHRRASRLS